MSWFRNDEADKKLGIGQYAQKQPKQEPNNPANRPDMSGVDVHAEVAKLTAERKKNGFGQVDWMPLVTGAGGMLLAHSLGSALMGRKSEEEERRQSIWERLLSAIIPIGLAAGGGYGGYQLGKLIKKSADGTTSQSQPPPFTAADLLAEAKYKRSIAESARDQSDSNAWKFYVPSAIGAAGAAGMIGAYGKGLFYDVPKYNKLNSVHQANLQASNNAIGESVEAAEKANEAMNKRRQAEAKAKAHPKSVKAQTEMATAIDEAIKARKNSAIASNTAKSISLGSAPEAPFKNIGVRVKVTPKGPVPASRPGLLGGGLGLGALSYLGFRAGNAFADAAKEYDAEADRYEHDIEALNAIENQ